MYLFNNQNVKFLCLKVINAISQYKKLWLAADDREDISKP